MQSLIDRMDAQRTHWAALPDGKRVQFRRPLETEFGKFRTGVHVEHLCEYAIGWEGFTEADLLGAAVGGSDVAPFSPELWARVVRDRIAYVTPLAEALVECIRLHLEAKDGAAKN
jgi:hypothetical protein